MANAQCSVPAVEAASITAPASTLSMDFSVALSSARRPVVPLATTDTTLGATVSRMSASVTVSVPAADSSTCVSVSAAAARSPAPIAMTGASLVPVTVATTVRSTVPPWPSAMRTVKDSATCWPRARCCTAALAMP